MSYIHTTFCRVHYKSAAAAAAAVSVASIALSSNNLCMARTIKCTLGAGIVIPFVCVCVQRNPSSVSGEYCKQTRMLSYSSAAWSSGC